MNKLPEFITITDKGIIIPTVKKELKLVPSNDPILITPISWFDHSKHNAIEIANDLIEAMQKFGGKRLAANQIGLSHRVFVMGKDDHIISYFNPEIIQFSENKIKLQEGCLSFPGMFLKVSRPKEIEVSYPSYDGKQHAAKFDGLTARIFQHELDHLNGVCFTECVGKTTLTMAKNKQAKLLKKLDRTKK